MSNTLDAAQDENIRLRDEVSRLSHICATQRVAIRLLEAKLEIKVRGTDGFGSTGGR